jgi:hypothetical protein
MAMGNAASKLHTVEYQARQLLQRLIDRAVSRFSRAIPCLSANPCCRRQFRHAIEHAGAELRDACGQSASL